jgi:hypothetical protein
MLFYMEKESARKHPPVDTKYAGKWIAWDQEQVRIVASGHTFRETYNAAIQAGEPDPLLAKVPDYGVRFIGGALV